MHHSLLLALALAASLFALVASERVKDHDTVYRHDRYGITFAPPDFDDDETAPNVTLANFLAPPKDGFAANVNIQRQKFEGGIEAYAKLSEKQFEDGHFEVLSSRPSKVGAREAHEFHYKGSVGGADLEFRALAVDDGGPVLLIPCTAPKKSFDAYTKKFDAALASLKLAD